MSTTFKKVKNRVLTTIKTGSSINNSDDPVIFNVTSVALFPIVPFYITVEQLTDNTVYERMLVTDVTGDQFTATRAQDGSSKQTFSAGDLVMIRVIAAHIDEATGAINTLEDLKDYADSPMIVTGGTISEGTNAGTFKVAALTALLRNTDSLTGELVEVLLAEQDNQAITAADTTYFVSLNYNGGTPTISVSATDPYTADKRNIPIGKVRKDGANNVHFINGSFNLQDGVRKLHERARELRELELESGSAIAYSGTNNFTMEAAVVYSGINRISLGSYDSAAVVFTYIYQDGIGGWTEVPTQNVIDFAHYDDGDGIPGNVGVAKYGCHWVYRHSDDGHIYIVLGRGSYSLAQAEAADEPTKPTHLTDFGCLIGKIVAPQAGGSFTTIQMVTERFFTGTAVSDHGNLAGLTDDDHPQYIKDSEFTQDSGVLVGTGAGTFQEETGATLRTSLGLGTGDSLTFLGLTLQTGDASDPTLIFKTTNTAHQIDVYLDESSANDLLIMEGKTASVDFGLHLHSVDGENCQIELFSGATNKAQIIMGAADHLSILNSVQDKNLILGIDDGGVLKTITWNAANDKLQHSAGTFNFDNDNLTTTGTLACGTITGSSNATFVTNATIKRFAANSSVTISSYSDDDPTPNKSLLNFLKSHQDTEGNTITVDGEGLGAIVWYGVDTGSGTSAASAEIRVEQEGAAGGVYVPTRMIISTGTGAALVEALRIDSSQNFGFGVSALETWGAGKVALQFGGNAALYAETAAGAGNQFRIVQNAYYDATNVRWEYQDTDEASMYIQRDGTHQFLVAASGTADTAISWITALIVNNEGSLSIYNNTLTAAAADSFKICSADLSAGHTQLALYGEGTCIGTGTPTPDGTIAIMVNGVQKYIITADAAT